MGTKGKWRQALLYRCSQRCQSFGSRHSTPLRGQEFSLVVQSLICWVTVQLPSDLWNFPSAEVLPWNVGSASLLLDLFMEALGMKSAFG